MTPTLGTEKPTVQDPIVKYAGEIGWNVVSLGDALSLRKGESRTLFYRILEELETLYEAGPQTMDTSTGNAVNLQMKEKFKAEITRWAAVTKVKPTQMCLQRMTKKWASCSSKGRVCFSADLLQEPRTFQEFVIVHELLHLQVPNHSIWWNLHIWKGILRGAEPLNPNL